MNQMVEGYLQSKKYAWADSTFNSERRRLVPLTPFLDGVPERLWEALRNKAPYTRVTSWTRVCDFWSWMIEEGHRPGPNPYVAFRKKNRRLFKNAYRRKLPEITYKEASERIQEISDLGVREKALELLTFGYRWSESFNKEEGGVIGKGNKWRPSFQENEISSEASNVSYTRLYKALRKIGLRPHDLRKLAATEFYRRGLSEVDLCHVMGWESFNTAKSYVAPKKHEELKEIICPT